MYKIHLIFRHLNVPPDPLPTVHEELLPEPEKCSVKK